MGITIIDAIYHSRGARIYNDCSPSLRAERKGLVVKHERDCDAQRRSVGEAERAEQTDMGCGRNSTDIDSNLRWRSASESPQERERESMEQREVYRRLTPKEYWRLMGFSDEDYEKAAAVNSPTQLYKQAGNSIVVDVLMAIFKEML